ncbi:MAG: ABC transporter permease [Verrucomicrobia bacterium]|nr:ABC transporter permease [Verrucomicrobiota bacterium]
MNLVLESGRAERHYWRDLWRYRELFYFLAWRDLLVRYKQTAIGVAWALIRPFLTMVVFTVVFGKLAKLPSGGVPYPILVFAGMLPWQFFSNALSESSGSLVSNANLISKVYFPRLIVPAGAVIVGFVDFLISFVIMAALMVWYGFLYSLNPMVGVIDGFRWAICGGEFAIYWPGFAASLAITAFFLWFGVRYFRATERTFADVI